VSKLGDNYRLKILVVVLLLSAAARLPTLTWRSFDSDEGATLHFSSLPYKELVTHLGDLSLERHPLLYYVFLKAWREVAGDSDLLIRLPSALAGMLTAAVTYQIGRRRLGPATAGLAMLLVALNPLLVFQHQEARMYAFAILFTTLAVWSLWEALDVHGSRARMKLAAFSVSLLAAAYSHFVASLLFPAMGLVLLWGIARGRPMARRGMGALVIAAVAYSPYVINIFRSGNSGSGASPFEDWSRTALGAATTLLDYQTVLNFPSSSSLLFMLLALILLLAVWRGRGEGVNLALWLVPVLAITILVTVRINFFQTKIFSFGAVPLALMTALAILGKTKRIEWHSFIPACAAVIFLLYSLVLQWRPGFRQEDFRHAAQFVESQATGDDSVILHLAWTQWVFSHYYQGQFSYPLPNNVDGNTSLGPILDPFLDAEVLWLVQAGVGLAGSGGDPHRLVQRWLGERYPVVTEVFPGGIDVRGYATRYRLDSLPESAIPLNAVYENGLQLVGYRLAQKEYPVRDRWLHPPSSWVPVTLYWSPQVPLNSGVHISLLLEDEPGNVWGGAISRENGVQMFHPPSDWQTTQIVRWDVDINANAEIPPGGYKLVLRLRQPSLDAALSHDGGNDWLILDRVSFVK
jgi:hypothetical protein